MKIIFVGVKRKYQELDSSYRNSFTRYHLELPAYFSDHPGNQVYVTTVDYRADDQNGKLFHITEEDSKRTSERFDVAVHWRKWFDDLYRGEAINVINCQDHSFSSEWKANVVRAFERGRLYGIMCFPRWHKENLFNELEGKIPYDRLLDGMTLGVDTNIYKPAVDKDPHQMLWASDPGRGLGQALQLAVRLHSADRRFRLHICRPDYASPINVSHPAVVVHDNVPNGPKLWDLFNHSGILPYTSNFREPSSRSHRQAMAAGALVLYPPGMGTPSDLIRDGRDGFVRDIQEWPQLIMDAVTNGTWRTIGENARFLAYSERWEVQAQRFTHFFQGLLGG